jgi:hypothetical protein
MKHLNVPFDDETYDDLRAAKGDRSWQEAICEEFGVDD